MLMTSKRGRFMMRLPDARNGTAIACNEPVLGIENRQELTLGRVGCFSRN